MWNLLRMYFAFFFFWLWLCWEHHDHLASWWDLVLLEGSWAWIKLLCSLPREALNSTYRRQPHWLYHWTFPNCLLQGNLVGCYKEISFDQLRTGHVTPGAAFSSSVTSFSPHAGTSITAGLFFNHRKWVWVYLFVIPETSFSKCLMWILFLDLMCFKGSWIVHCVDLINFGTLLSRCESWFLQSVFHPVCCRNCLLPFFLVKAMK